MWIDITTKKKTPLNKLSSHDSRWRWFLASIGGGRILSQSNRDHLKFLEKKARRAKKRFLKSLGA